MIYAPILALVLNLLAAPRDVSRTSLLAMLVSLLDCLWKLR